MQLGEEGQASPSSSSARASSSLAGVTGTECCVGLYLERCSRKTASLMANSCKAVALHWPPVAARWLVAALAAGSSAGHRWQSADLLSGLQVAELSGCGGDESDAAFNFGRNVGLAFQVTGGLAAPVLSDTRGSTADCG